LRIVITGGTGFLGLRLVRELLAEHRSLTLLARRGPAETLDLIARFLALSAESPELISELPERITVRRADVTEPRFGLSEAEFAALAADVDVLWHCAGDTTLDADLNLLRRVNVDGTRNALDLVGRGRRRPLLYHVSTAFVAGKRQYGTVYDDELTDAYGFETPYEQSKYEAETEIRRWQRRHGRPVVVFRPSILTSDLAYDPDLPPHPFITAVLTLSAIKRAAAGTYDARPMVRLTGNPDAQLNVIPVEDAAAVMVRLSRLPPARRVDTYHVVHAHEVPAATVLRALGEAIGAEFVLVRELDDRTPLETRLHLLLSATAYVKHQRRYDDARVRDLVDCQSSRGPVDLDYLLAATRLVPGSAAQGQSAQGQSAQDQRARGPAAAR
jgi:thioester reductase-like protein